MDVTGGTRALVAAGATVMLGGLSVIFYGVIRDAPSRVLGGACLTITAFSLLALVVIRRWIVDTSEERRVLAAAQREAVAERTRYISAKAALENEHGRLNRDMATERRHLTVRMKQERKAMREEFEEMRSTLIAETMEATLLMMRDGKLNPAPSTTGNLIQFPHQQAQPHPERARTREH